MEFHPYEKFMTPKIRINQNGSKVLFEGYFVTGFNNDLKTYKKKVRNLLCLKLNDFDQINIYFYKINSIKELGYIEPEDDSFISSFTLSKQSPELVSETWYTRGSFEYKTKKIDCLTN